MDELTNILPFNNQEQLQIVNIDILSDVKNKIYIYGTIDEELAVNFIMQLHHTVDSMIFHYNNNHELFLEKFNNEIIIYLSTSGGILWDAFSIYQAIREVSKSFKITIHCYGKVMSAGLLILAAGDERTSAADTVFMVHEAATDVGGHTSYILNELEDLKKVSKKYFEVLSKRFGNNNLKQLVKPNMNTYFSATKAKELGLLTKITK